MIKLFIIDIDGCLTDGCYYVDACGSRSFKFNTRDMHGLMRLSMAGVDLGIVTQSDNRVIKTYMHNMTFDIDIQLKMNNKLEKIEEMAMARGITLYDVAYIGDDLPDIAALEKVGIAACPHDAEDEVIKAVESRDDGIVMDRDGGAGCVREFANYILDLKKIEEQGDLCQKQMSIRQS